LSRSSLKTQQYQIFKFKSARLKQIKYKIEIDIKTAYKNGEIISLGESELIRIINRLKNKNSNPETTHALIVERRLLKKLPNSKENKKRISEINNELEKSLFIPEIVNIEFDSPAHYKQIIKNGLFINGKKFERLLTGAGMARRSTVQFVEVEFGKELKRIINNDRNPSLELVDSKYNAYYALASSASYPVTLPRFCVIDDCKIIKNRMVDFVVETEKDQEDYVEERILPIEANVFDGQGLISLEMADKWAKDLGLNYTPNSFCIRGSYLKGQLVSFDFHAFAESANKNFFVDIWGNEVDIRNIDVILTVSQLKLWNAYSSCQNYVDACQHNGIGWGVSLYTPKKEKDFFYSSYQLLQVLDLTKEQIEEMCKPTINWITKVAGGDVNYALLYLLGSIADTTDEEEIKDLWVNELSRLNNWNLKALLLNHDLFGDSYFKRAIYQTLNKKIREFRMGKLLFPGNWQVCIADPYAFCQFIFGMEVTGLLQEGEHYSYYWNNKNIDTVASGRSPLTWKSEMNILNLKNSNLLNKWFGHIHSGIIFNIHGIDTMLMADSDFDYDLAFSTSQKEFIIGACGGKPVTYEKKLPNKNIIDESKLYIADINTMGSAIGWITNLGTTLYSLLPLFKEGSPEYNEIISRLIIIRKAQGNEIDRGKGILVKSPPKWDRWIKITDDMTEEEKTKANFKNKLVINRRPKFMIYLYPDYMRKYKNHRDIYQNYCESIYGYGLNDLLDNPNRTPGEENIYKQYMEFNPFIDSDSIMGIICRYMEKSLEEIKISLKDNNSFEVAINSLYDYSEVINPDDLANKNKLMREAYRHYKSIKEGIYNFDDTQESVGIKIQELNQWAYEKISSNGAELANLALNLCYTQYKSTGNRDFAWKVFGKEIVDNLIKNGYDRAYIPLADQFGDIYYLGKRYSNLGIKIEGEI
jgi:hypothetical protein